MQMVLLIKRVCTAALHGSSLTGGAHVAVLQAVSLHMTPTHVYCQHVDQ